METLHLLEWIVSWRKEIAVEKSVKSVEMILLLFLKDLIELSWKILGIL